MFGRLVEKMIRGTNKSSQDDGYLSRYLDAICPRFASLYDETLKACQNASDSAMENIDALDVLAKLVMEELGIHNIEVTIARAYLSILIDNEHLPTLSQLSESELGILRELLFAYFRGDDYINEKGAQVLALIEQKFTNGAFSQAKILLQIFETNNETRQNNERNLYYEEMNVRLDTIPTKSKPLSASLVQAAIGENATDEAILKAFAQLEQNASVRFCLYLRDNKELEKWQSAVSPLPKEIQEYLLDYVPIIRWRKLGALSGQILSQAGQHMTFEMLRYHVQQKLRMCYFILLASGNTGYEWFIFAFSRWSKKYFDVDVREVFPMLHRSGIIDGMCLQEDLDVTTDRFYGRKMNEISITPESLATAFHAAVKFILESDISLIPSGQYNFGDFILDAILPFDYEDPMFAYRIHSMM